MGCGYAGPSDCAGERQRRPVACCRPRAGRESAARSSASSCAHVHELGFTRVGSRVDGRRRRLACVRRPLRLRGGRPPGRAGPSSSATSPPPEPPPGVAFVTIAERPDLLREAYELGRRWVRGHGARPPVTISLDDWLREEATLPGGSFVALAGDEIVGYSGLCDPRDGVAEDGLTVVRRNWRRRGRDIIASASTSMDKRSFSRGLNSPIFFLPKYHALIPYPLLHSSS